MTDNTYTAGDIKQLEGLEAIRRRPGMYIGPTDIHALLHLLKEVVANSVDEVLGGYADRIEVILRSDGSAAISDNGRGIPVEWQAEAGMSALTQVLTQLHAGGKFSDTAYNVAGGLHGVGLKANNALSDFLTVEVRRAGVTFRQKFVNGGEPDSEVEIVDAAGRVAGEINELTTLIYDEYGRLIRLEQAPSGRRRTSTSSKVKPDRKLGTGTAIRFRPWRDYFDDIEGWDQPDRVPWPLKLMDYWFTQLAYLYPGLALSLTDERAGGETRLYQAKGGLAGYVEYLNAERPVLHKPIILTGEAPVEVSVDGQSVTRTLRLELALQYTKTDETEIYAFTNGIHNPDGGTHVTGFQSALTRVLKQAGTVMRGVKGAGEIIGSDTLFGLTATLAVTMPWEPKFEGQTKRKLLSPEAQGVVQSLVYQELQTQLDKQKKTLRAILDQVISAAHSRQVAAKARQLSGSRSASDAARTGILGKLTPVAGGRNAVSTEERELYLVEGDSAGGTAKQGRDPRRQAILPLRGKPLNAEGRKLATILDNKEFAAIIAAIGAGVGREFTLAQMAYGRVIILADADPDGGHITALLLTFFFRQMRPLIEAGRLAVAEPPLFKVEAPAGSRYCYSESERDRALTELGRGGLVKRFKGLGEMSDDELREAVLANPAGQRVVVIEDIHAAGRQVAALMGSDSSARQLWLEGKLREV